MGCCEGKARPNTDGHAVPERPPANVLQRERTKQLPVADVPTTATTTTTNTNTIPQEAPRIASEGGSVSASTASQILDDAPCASLHNPRLTEAVIQILTAGGSQIGSTMPSLQQCSNNNSHAQADTDVLAHTALSLDKTGKTFASDDTFIMLTEPSHKHPHLPSPRKRNDDDPGPSVPYKKTKPLGRGQYGVVSEAVDTKGYVFAVKCVDARGFPDIAFVKRELDSLRRLVHKNVVRYYGCEYDAQSGSLEVLMECCHYGTLSDKIRTSEGHRLSMSHIRIYSRQILNGLLYLHGNGVVHTDVKAVNVLLGDSGLVKLADFGWLEPGLAKARGERHIGSPAWLAPEVVKNPETNPHPKSDIWSFGCTIVEMLGHNPWGSLGTTSNPFALLYRICDTDDVPAGMPMNLPRVLNDMMLRCFERLLMDRPDAADLLTDEFFDSAYTHGSSSLMYHDDSDPLMDSIPRSGGVISEGSPSSASYDEVSSPLSPY